MGTRSNIGIINRDGSVEMIYCHWDGYPSNNGKILLENYTNEDKLRALLELGDLSSLGPELGTQHDFDFGMKLMGGSLEDQAEYDRLSNMCTAYGRDRGEQGCKARTYKTVKGALKAFKSGWGEYVYLFDTKTHTWLYGSSYINSHAPDKMYILTPTRCKE